MTWSCIHILSQDLGFIIWVAGSSSNNLANDWNSGPKVDYTKWRSNSGISMEYSKGKYPRA